MEPYSTRLLALVLALGFSGALPAGHSSHEDRSRGAQPDKTTTQGDEGEIVWDCVPNYWFGTWTWAWQPCAWIDRTYVEGAIGAIAEAPAAETDEPLEPQGSL